MDVAKSATLNVALQSVITTAVMTITSGTKERTIISAGISRFINELVRIKNGGTFQLIVRACHAKDAVRAAFAALAETQWDLLSEFVSVTKSYPSLDNAELVVRSASL